MDRRDLPHTLAAGVNAPCQELHSHLVRVCDRKRALKGIAVLGVVGVVGVVGVMRHGVRGCFR